ncbi:MAG: DMT family transporter [Saprospiraceae bacterium]
MLQSSPAQIRRAYLALAAICIIWGTTYTAIKFAVRDFPPFLLVSIRQLAAGVLLLAWVFAQQKVAWPDKKYLLRQSITGLATITGGNGCITWAMQYVSSGLSAVIGSLTPVMVVLINLAWRGSEKINALIICGVLLGFGGLGIVFSDGWRDFANPDYRWGLAGCLASCFTWSLGTVMAKRWNDTRLPLMFNAGIQITAGGLGAVVLGLLFDPTWQIRHSPEGWASVAYLAVIGSALAFTLYTFALKHLSTTVSSLYTYINPVVAILLGWLLLGEHLSWMELGGMAVTMVGVYLVNLGNRRD